MVILACDFKLAIQRRFHIIDARYQRAFLFPSLLCGMYTANPSPVAARSFTRTAVLMSSLFTTVYSQDVTVPPMALNIAPQPFGRHRFLDVGYLGL